MEDIPTPLEADWVQALDQAESDISRILNAMPKDKVKGYVEDLNIWSRRVGDEAVARAFRSLFAMGYSKSSIASTLGMGGPSLNRVLREDSFPRRNSVSTVVPENFIDIREAFAELSR